MKTRYTILVLAMGFIVSCSTLKQTQRAPSSPEELGNRVAQALLDGDTKAIAICLPSLEAYAPIMQAFGAEGNTSTDALRAYREREVQEMTELVATFPAEVEKETGLRIADVRSTVVEVRKTNSVFTDIIITFQTSQGAYKMRLDECMKYRNHWYVLDFDWMGREENSEQSSRHVPK